MKKGRDEKRAMERTCIFVISDCLPFSRQIDFYISCYWKLSRLDCQACLALASAAKPVFGLYDLALGRTFKAFNSQVISVIQYYFCPHHLCCFLSLSFASCSLFLFFSFHLSFSNPLSSAWVSRKSLFSCPYLFVCRKGGLVASRWADYLREKVCYRTHTRTKKPPADI